MGRSVDAAWKVISFGADRIRQQPFSHWLLLWAVAYANEFAIYVRKVSQCIVCNAREANKMIKLTWIELTAWL